MRVVDLSGDPTHLVGGHYVVTEVFGKKPSDAYSEVDLAVRWLNLIIAEFS